MKVLAAVALMGVGALWIGSAVFVVLIFAGLGVPGSIAVTTVSMLPEVLAIASGLALILREGGTPPGVANVRMTSLARYPNLACQRDRYFVRVIIVAWYLPGLDPRMGSAILVVLFRRRFSLRVPGGLEPRMNVQLV